MNFHSLRYFIEVAKTLSFTKASKNLFVSQPGISQQIHLLEEQLGVRLLHRTTRKVELTEEGKYLLERIFPSVSEIESTISHLMESHTFPTLLKIATIPSAASLYLPKALKELHQFDSHLEFTIKETTSREVKQLIKNKMYHIGFIRIAPDFQSNKEDGLHALEIERSPMKAVVSSTHRLATKESIQLTDLHDDLFLHYDSLQSPALYHLLEDACNDVGFRPKTICTGSELLTMASMIAHNVGVTLLPQDMLELVMSPNLKALHLEDVRLESSIAIIWRDDGDLYDHKHTFIQQLQHLECVVK
ncbi:MAG TPA: LysR family transcriptional regulator [Bacillota bacterium]|nr:LysR family transcriptional regulator [Bacillota bacterium]